MFALSLQKRVTTEVLAGKGPGETLLWRWLAFFGWILVLYLFIFQFAPWLQRHNGTMDRLGRYIRESGIDAGAIYYTEVGEVGEADLAIRNTFRFYLQEQVDRQKLSE